MEYLSLFLTTSGSVKFKRKLQKENIPVEALPVPRMLSSNCGIAVKFFCSEDPFALIDEGLQKLYRIENDNFILLWENH